jgi:DNA ligase-associated metallophosphoesterase
VTPVSRATEISIAGETLALYAERAVYWPRARTLLVADVHWGKAATFRAAAIPVPRGTTAESLTRLDAVLSHTGANRLIVLGDLFHAREGRAAETLRTVEIWRARHASLELTLVRGNHDRHAGDPPPELGIGTADGPLHEPPFVFTHHPMPSEGAYVVAGHLHPGVRLGGAGGLHARVPCFWFGRACAVLPAFGSFTGLAPISPERDDLVFALAGDEVIPVTATATLSPRRR